MITIIQNIKFFDHASTCISYFEKTSWTKKTLSLIQSFGTLLIYFLNRMKLFCCRVEVKMAPYTNDAIVNLSRQKLVVCIHSLNNSPAQFKKILDEMQKQALTDTAIYIPYVTQKGRAKLDDQIQPIFEKIKAWAETKGDKELVLVGISNGGRIAKAIEAKLINSGSQGNIKKIKFLSIVGACNGSSLATLAHPLHLTWLMPKNISEEMPTDSKRMRQLNEEWELALESSSDLELSYTFIASPHDWQVPNYDSTLMEIPKYQTKYALITGHGHNSIVNASAKAVAEIIFS